MNQPFNHFTAGQVERLSPEAEALVTQIKERARSLYLTRQLLCTESIMVALNQGLDGGLSEAQALAMAAPFSVALGESGCMCGALSGAVMASGLFLGNHHPHRHRRVEPERGGNSAGDRVWPLLWRRTRDPFRGRRPRGVPCRSAAGR